MSRCSEITKYLTCYVERELPPELSKLVDDHLDQCAKCVEMIDKIERSTPCKKQFMEPGVSEKYWSSYKSELFEKAAEAGLVEKKSPAGFIRRFLDGSIRIPLPVATFALLLMLSISVVGSLGIFKSTTTNTNMKASRGVQIRPMSVEGVGNVRNVVFRQQRQRPRRVPPVNYGRQLDRYMQASAKHYIKLQKRNERVKSTGKKYQLRYLGDIPAFEEDPQFRYMRGSYPVMQPVRYDKR